MRSFSHLSLTLASQAETTMVSHKRCGMSIDTHSVQSLAYLNAENTSRESHSLHQAVFQNHVLTSQSIQTISGL